MPGDLKSYNSIKTKPTDMVILPDTNQSDELRKKEDNNRIFD